MEFKRSIYNALLELRARSPIRPVFHKPGAGMYQITLQKGKRAKVVRYMAATEKDALETGEWLYGDDWNPISSTYLGHKRKKGTIRILNGGEWVKMTRLDFVAIKFFEFLDWLLPCIREHPKLDDYLSYLELRIAWQYSIPTCEWEGGEEHLEVFKNWYYLKHPIKGQE